MSSEKTLEALRLEIDAVDREMAELFDKRMKTVAEISEAKGKNGRIFDGEREKAVIEKNAAFVSGEMRDYYVRFQQNVLDLSKDYQRGLLSVGRYDDCVYIESGLLSRAGDFFRLDRKVAVVTDGGVPAEYVGILSAQCRKAVVITLESGEDAKSAENAEMICREMMENGFTRKDCVVSVGGGKVCDIAGFAAAIYMRGIDFYSVPTTVLAQCDASVGGKNGVNLGSVKNVMGTFRKPNAVIIDPSLAETLDRKSFSEGMAEIIKIAAVLDRELFERIERGAGYGEVISDAVKLKLDVTGIDFRENGLRSVLNFGHTVGHGIELECGLMHGEAVAVGMIAMSEGEARERISALLAKYGLPVSAGFDTGRVMLAVSHDKKSADGRIKCIICREIGKYEIEELDARQIEERLGSVKR